MGGSVAGGCVGGTDVFVAGTEVGGTGVFVGMRRVEVGRDVGGAAVMVPVVVGPGSRVRGVAVTGKVAVGEGVIVAEGVAVGIVGVRVGRSEAVAVGTVEVGKGPSSASEVNARAVLVLLAVRKMSAVPPEPPKAYQNHRSKPSNRISTCRARELVRRFVTFNSSSFLSYSDNRFYDPWECC